ncbi:hypothetical protein E4U41_005499, partial [Claviceps citrina]
SCQEFIRRLSESVTAEQLLSLPVSTSITVIGCGDPALIGRYAEATRCGFDILTDPSGSLYEALGLGRTLALGTRPAYMRKSMLASTLDGIWQAVRCIPEGLALRSGDHRRVGGEFLFEPEPADVVGPERGEPVRPRDREPDRGDDDDDDDDDDAECCCCGREGCGPSREVKRMTWCHRMTTTRDHAEIPELMDVLGLEAHGEEPTGDEKRWSEAPALRKGTGTTMGPRLRELMAERARS